jgi:hypothetical protein
MHCRRRCGQWTSAPNWVPTRYDQDLGFGSANLKSAFWLVKFLEDVGYPGSRHFDAHAYRREDYEGVRDSARVHADLPDLEGEGEALEYGSGDSNDLA